jgi:cruciform cutting endonuclease 1
MSSPKNPFSAFLASSGPTVKTIQDLLHRIGAPTSGTKEVLQSRLFREFIQWKSAIHNNRGRLLNNTRILSIDMGIKNLAFCVARVGQTIEGKNSMNVISWRRLDLTDDMMMSNKKHTQDLTTNARYTRGDDPFAPEFLSYTAWTLMRHNLMRYRPNVVLIERQRWRSSSSSAIQQWTVRVNSLEAMLWAVLRTMEWENKMLPQSQRNQTKKEMTLCAVDPKRAGTYWLDNATPLSTPAPSKKKVVEEEEPDDEDEQDDAVPAQEILHPEASRKVVKKLSRGKAEKKAKIQLLRTWLDSEKPSTILSAHSDSSDAESTDRPTIDFTFTNEKNYRAEAERTRQTFLYATDSPSQKKKRIQDMDRMQLQIREEDVKKVDDLTDCMVQAVSWVAWQDNREKLKKQFDEFVTDVEGMTGTKLRANDRSDVVSDVGGKLHQEHAVTTQRQEAAKDI